MKELWQTVDEVDHLRDEEEKQGLAEVAKNCNHCQRHSAEKNDVAM